jgi:hypothetical protein
MTNRTCCIDEDIGTCPASANPPVVPGEVGCDDAIKAFCTDKDNANNARCSCFSNPEEIAGDKEKLAQWVCFSRSCFGSDKLVPRAWRDLKCPDYVSCRTQIKLKGNIRALPDAIKIHQDCKGGAGGTGALSLNSTDVKDIRSKKNKEADARLQKANDWFKDHWLQLAGGAVLFILLIALIFGRKKSQSASSTSR